MAAGYRLFNVRLESKTPVTPSLLRCVFSGPEIHEMKLDGPDQRIKLLFASEQGGATTMQLGESWYDDYLALPRESRPLMRTYTLRAVDARHEKAVVEFVLHGETGPASRWAMHASPGDSLQMVAPNALSDEDSGGYEWLPHSGVEQVLLIADETALPAAKSILENLAQQATPPQVQAFFEVPLHSDCSASGHFPFAHICWLPREATGSHIWGERLLAAVKERFKIPSGARLPQTALVEEIPEGELLWELASGDQPFYAWVAAESTAVKHLRRYLLDECGLDRSTITFMAYWSSRPSLPGR